MANSIIDFLSEINILLTDIETEVDENNLRMQYASMSRLDTKEFSMNLGICLNYYYILRDEKKNKNKLN